MSKADEVRQRIVETKSMDDRACLDCACYLRAAEVVKTFKAAL